MSARKKNNNKIFPSIKKDVQDFLTSEEGSINKKDVAQIAMKVLALGIGLAGAMKPDQGEAVCSHASHASHGSHSSHASHSSHSSY